MKRLKGSLTLETALVLPIFLFLSINMISFIEIMNCYIEMEYAIHETARDIAILSYINDKSDEDIDIPELAAEAIFISKVGAKKINAMPIKNGMAGINIFRSEIEENGYIDLVITYRVTPLCNVFGVGEQTLINRAKIHTWTGFSGLEDISEDAEYVYMTEYGTVYHTRRECSHLCIKISNEFMEDLENIKNKEGEKYRPCDKCAKGKIVGSEDIIYVTDSGQVYHLSLDCSGLKRTVFKVQKSEVGGIPMCERCQKYSETRIKIEDGDVYDSSGY